ncbi:hypothetical protein TSUD_98960 [Trifolium subterraneum]|uniref:Reverse transcriptase Ty1/copia-type domain-containing protein n=1 Tax=Trifolium subterraneum TaxID=3900 RepID=A0A2Z6PL38_TRISU|nr:hypothetical protein TSUD_98960 [Trifolium subterraneum]
MSVDSVASVNGGSSSSNHHKGYQNDTLNPYFLHSNENPSLVLVQTPLSGSNYHQWSRAMVMALRSKNKLHFINGSFPRPMDEDLDSLAWDRCNTMIMSWLNNAVAPEISQSIIWMDSASEIWQDLKERFYQGDVFRISDIQEEIYTLKQVIRFLKGLNEQYSAVRYQIMLMEPLPNICKVYSLLVQQERQAVTPIDESKLLAVSGNSYGNPSNPPVGRGYGGLGREIWLPSSPDLQHLQHQHGNNTGSGHGNGNGNGHGHVNNCVNNDEEDTQSIAYDEGILCNTSSSHSFTRFILDTGATDHEAHTQKKIGVAEMHDGLYILQTPVVSIGKLPITNFPISNASYNQTFYDDLLNTQPYSHPISHSNHPQTNSPIHVPSSSIPNYPSHTDIPSTSHNHISTDNHPAIIANDHSHSPQSHNSIPSIHPTRKSTRISKPPPYLQNYHCNHITSIVHDSSETTHQSSSNCKYPLSSFVSYNNLSSAHKHYALNISTINEPNTYEEAMCDVNWRNTINAELSALMKNNTWNLVQLPTHKRAIGCKWVFNLKLHADGFIERHKARLVAKGFTQTEGIDYMETFSPVVKMTTVRVFMALAASQNWPVFQLDVNTAFLHGDLNEEVYMQAPPGLALPHPNLVCKLQRSLYGLKQASRQWNAKLTETLIASGFTQSKADYSLFTKKTCQGFIAILVYVDDLVLGGTDMTEINQLKALLDQKFSIKDLGSLKYFLGFEVARSKSGISLCQRKYTLALKGYSDSDWVACPDTRRSTTGVCFFIGTSLISWKRKKQSVVSRSSSEAEYRALAQTTCEGQWLLYLLKDFLIAHDSPIIIYRDNKSAMHIAANLVFHERTKHIEIDCHVVRDKIQNNTVHLLPVSSKELVADIFTKSLQPGPFHTLQSKLGTFDIYSSLRGHVDNEDIKL